MKLFREWCTKWPEDYKDKLVETVSEMDPTYGDKLHEKLKSATNGYQNGHQNGETNGNGSVDHQNGHHTVGAEDDGDVIEPKIEPVPNSVMAMVEDLIVINEE